MRKPDGTVTDQAYKPDPIPPKKTDRSKTSFAHCKVISRSDEKPFYSVIVIDPITGRDKTSRSYVFSSPLPLGEYDIVDDCEHYIVLKNVKSGNHFLCDLQLASDINCRTCNGRGYYRVKKQPSKDDPRKFVEKDCIDCELQGVTKGLMTEIPQLKFNDNALEKEVLDYLDIESVFVYDLDDKGKGQWQAYPPSAKNLKVRKFTSKIGKETQQKQAKKKATNE